MEPDLNAIQETVTASGLGIAGVEDGAMEGNEKVVLERDGEGRVTGWHKETVNEG